MMSVRSALIAALLTASAVVAQSARASKDLNVAEVVTLVEAKLPDAVVVKKIQESGKKFDLSADDLIKLKKSGASEAVMLSMMGMRAAPAPAAASRKLARHCPSPKSASTTRRRASGQRCCRRS